MDKGILYAPKNVKSLFSLKICFTCDVYFQESFLSNVPTRKVITEDQVIVKNAVTCANNNIML